MKECKNQLQRYWMKKFEKIDLYKALILSCDTFQISSQCNAKQSIAAYNLENCKFPIELD